MSTSHRWASTPDFAKMLVDFEATVLPNLVYARVELKDEPPHTRCWRGSYPDWLVTIVDGVSDEGERVFEAVAVKKGLILRLQPELAKKVLAAVAATEA